jgi:hypothetical protein
MLHGRAVALWQAPPMCDGASWQGPATEQGPVQLSMYNCTPLYVFGRLLHALLVHAVIHYNVKYSNIHSRYGRSK